MDKISYSIVSRGEMQIKYNGKLYKITGELIYSPPTFYADLSSLNKIKDLDEEKKNKLVEFIKNDSLERFGTRIFFD